MAILYKTATIANGASLSSAVDIDGSALVGIVVPATFTGTSLTFQMSHDDTTYSNLYDETGTEVTVTISTSRYIRLNPSDWMGCDALKVRSGTSGSPTTQSGGDHSVILVLYTP